MKIQIWHGKREPGTCLLWIGGVALGFVAGSLLLRLLPTRGTLQDVPPELPLSSTPIEFELPAGD
ncbi:MAG: hypothetical protein AAGJ95_09465 [Cyanobacteria bacterium J06554_11]